MSELFASVDGHRLTSVRVLAGNIGPWSAECEFEEAPAISGRVTLTIGTLELSGTVLATQDGTFGLQRKCRIVAGASGWGHPLAPKGYHNDAGVKAKLVVEDAAREAGETLGTFVPVAERIGVDYARQRGPASMALEDVIGDGVAWWVDYAGVTHVGPRPAVPIDKAMYQVLAFDPATRVVTLAVDDPGAVMVGSLLSERLDSPQVVRELELVVDGDSMRVTAWCGGSATDPGRLSMLLRDIARKAVDGQLFGKYRYRVVRMAADARVELQAVRKLAGLPDLLPVALWPGLPGLEAELAPGSLVLVEFVEGDRAQPIITHFAGKHDGGPGVPVSLTLCGSTQRVARQGDLVQSGGVGTTIIIGLLGTGAPPNQAVVAGVPYPVSFSLDPLAVGPLAAPLYGAISTGSPKVKA
jgi:hypothetical protein